MMGVNRNKPMQAIPFLACTLSLFRIWPTHSKSQRVAWVPLRAQATTLQAAPYKQQGGWKKLVSSFQQAPFQAMANGVFAILARHRW